MSQLTSASLILIVRHLQSSSAIQIPISVTVEIRQNNSQMVSANVYLIGLIVIQQKVVARIFHQI